MRFTITALGATGGRTVDAAVGDLVRYLTEPLRPRGRSVDEAGRDGTATYYSEGAAVPGRWSGRGAARLGLAGAVDAEVFARVLSGRDPATGERLLSAAGSAGRRERIGVGQPTKDGPDGAALYGPADAAAALGLSRADVAVLIRAGDRKCLDALSCLVLGPRHFPESNGHFLAATRDDAGDRWISAPELARYASTDREPADPADVLAAGPAEEQLSLAEAARLAGVTSRYLRSRAAHWTANREQIERDPDGHPTAWIKAHRGTKKPWLIRRCDLADFISRRKPPAVRVGYDVTLTTEKSLGVLALLGDDRTKGAVLGAIEAANQYGIDWLEERARGRSRGDTIEIDGFTTASFEHLTSRALDPFPHHHNVIANSTLCADGVRRALDARPIYLNARVAGALATADLRRRLSTDLGVRWRPARHGGWEVDGISDRVIDEFSKRRGEISEGIADLEAVVGRSPTIDELQAIVMGTRPSKESVDPASLVEDWRDRAAEAGLSPDALRAAVGRSLKPQQLQRDAVLRALADPNAVTASSSVFTRDDAIVTLVDLPIGRDAGDQQPPLVGPSAVQAIVDDFLHSAHVIELDERSTEGRVQYSTVGMIELQLRVRERYERGVATGCGVAPVQDCAGLSGEQRALVAAWCTSGDRIQSAIGRAGSGKTTAMAAAARSWEAAGYRVLGAAVKGEAARVLGETAAIQAETVAWYLVHDDPATSPLDGRTVLIVDEASTLSDADLDQLGWLCEASGATLRLIGDPVQHGSVAAGGMWAYLCELHAERTPELQTARRVQHDDDRKAADALRDGRVDDAIRHLEQAGHLHRVDDESELLVALLTRWYEARAAGQPHPMVDRRNATRAVLNQLGHRLLQSTGEVAAEEVAASRDRHFAVGDEVIARLGSRDLHPPNDRKRWVRNGTTGVVVAVAPDQLRIRFRGIGEVDVHRSFFDHHRTPNGRYEAGVDHAYALTSYAVQGATYETSSSRVDPGSSRAELYVDLTRGREANHLYITPRSSALGDELNSVEDVNRTELRPRIGPTKPALALITDERLQRRIGLAAPREDPWFRGRTPSSGDVPALHEGRM